jgi:hypothetical protein
VRLRIEDEIRAALFRGNFLHSLIRAAQALNWLNPASIGVAIATSENVIGRNQFRLQSPLRGAVTDSAEVARQVPKGGSEKRYSDTVPPVFRYCRSGIVSNYRIPVV